MTSDIPVIDPELNCTTSGEEILDEVALFASRFAAFPSEHDMVAHCLWTAHTHAMDAWETTPRLAALSPEPASGKTRLLEITALLVPNPVEAVNVTSAYLFRKVGDAEGRPTILFDEIDAVFGPKAHENEDLRALLNAGHRKGASVGRCVVRGKTIEPVEIPAYCAVAMAGLGSLPETTLSRCVVIQMRRRLASERVEPYRYRKHAAEGHDLRDRLAAWVASASITWPTMPTGVDDRDADNWEPLLAIADAAGGRWPEKARVAAVALVTQASENPPSLGVRLLADTRKVFGAAEQVPTATLLDRLKALDESPWASMKSGPLDAGGLASLLRRYGIKPKGIRIGDKTPRGYKRADFLDAWERYLPPLSEEPATGATNATEPLVCWICGAEATAYDPEMHAVCDEHAGGHPAQGTDQGAESEEVFEA